MDDDKRAFLALRLGLNEPSEDQATCDACGWTGALTECLATDESDWESGWEATGYACPQCPTPDDTLTFSFSPAQRKRYHAYHAQRGKALLKHIAKHGLYEK